MGFCLFFDHSWFIPLVKISILKCMGAKEPMIKPIAITMGEPAGITGELIVQAWQKRKERHFDPFFAIDCPARLKVVAPDIALIEISSPEEAAAVFDRALPVLKLELAEKPQVGVLNPKNAASVIQSIERAVHFCLEGRVGAVVTNPIHKAALYDAGFKHPGHTEFIGKICSDYTGEDVTPVMMLVAKGLRVVPLTVHIPLRDVPEAISGELLENKCKIIVQALIDDFKIASPRVAVAGLNPHAGEDGTIGHEDQEIISPSIARLKDRGYHISGPYPADTLFHEEARAQYDIAIGMYHDQALIPLKTLDFHGGVNVTLGLPIIRTSPDHGTALNIAGKGIARADSFMNALTMAQEMAKNRGV